jgi:two-component system, sensor histidine kinase PdtaS
MTAPDQQLAIRVEGEALLLPAQAATALALVVNELVQNALDHAFTGRRAGEILISLGRSPEELVIVVRDNGAGLPKAPLRGVGLEIVETLVRDDLRGRLKFNRPGQGTEVTLRIPRSVEQVIE